MSTKKVRFLFYTGSGKKFNADENFGIQREILSKYVDMHPEWILDSKEYFANNINEKGKKVSGNDVLKEALKDAERGKYDILVAYKDRWFGVSDLEIPYYILSLKNAGVDFFTVLDGLLSPESLNDVSSIVVLTMRYTMASKSYSDACEGCLYHMHLKKVRMLLHSDSDQKLDTDESLDIQRNAIANYIAANHQDWILDSKEYFIDSNDVSKEATEDAERGEYDILVADTDMNLGVGIEKSVPFVIYLLMQYVDVYTVNFGKFDPFDDSGLPLFF